MATSKLISLNLHEGDIMLLDDLVLVYKAKSFTPAKVNRTTVIRDLLQTAMRERNKQATQVGGE